MTPAAALVACERVVLALSHRYARPGVDVDDLAQAGRLAVCRCVDSYDATRGTLPSFVYVPVMRSIRGAASRASRDVCASLDAPIGEEDGETYLDHVADDAPDSSDRLHDAQQAAVLRGIVATLDERPRLVVLRHLDGATLEETANELGCSREHVRQILEKALALVEKRMRYGGKTFRASTRVGAHRTQATHA